MQVLNKERERGERERGRERGREGEREREREENRWKLKRQSEAPETFPSSRFSVSPRIERPEEEC